MPAELRFTRVPDGKTAPFTAIAEDPRVPFQFTCANLLDRLCRGCYFPESGSSQAILSSGTSISPSAFECMTLSGFRHDVGDPILMIKNSSYARLTILRSSFVSRSATDLRNEIPKRWGPSERLRPSALVVDCISNGAFSCILTFFQSRARTPPEFRRFHLHRFWVPVTSRGSHLFTLHEERRAACNRIGARFVAATVQAHKRLRQIQLFRTSPRRLSSRGGMGLPIFVRVLGGPHWNLIANFLCRDDKASCKACCEIN